MNKKQFRKIVDDILKNKINAPNLTDRQIAAIRALKYIIKIKNTADWECNIADYFFKN